MDSHGEISLQRDAINFEWPTGSWSLPLDQVVIIGEFTTDQGPFVDDWWLCFVTLDEFHLAPLFARGAEAFLSSLGERLGHLLTLQLGNSADYVSRILWPAKLAGKPIFTYTPQLPRTRVLRLIAKLVDSPALHVGLSPDVERYLTEFRDSSSSPAPT